MPLTVSQVPPYPILVSMPGPEEAGADAFAGINTIGPALVLGEDGRPYL